jgi:hypothetical protein
MFLGLFASIGQSALTIDPIFAMKFFSQRSGEVDFYPLRATRVLLLPGRSVVDPTRPESPIFLIQATQKNQESRLLAASMSAKKTPVWSAVHDNS